MTHPADGARRRPGRTRPPAGARLAFACGLALTLAAPGARAGVRDTGPLPWRVGGRVGFTADAAAFPDSAGDVLDVYVRIPPATLAALTRDVQGEGRLRVSARLRSAYGSGKAQEQNLDFAIEPPDSAGGFGKVVSLRFPTRPGDQRLLVSVEDVFSRKRGLIYSGRNVTESAHIEGELRVPAPLEGRALSDIEFVWWGRPGGPTTAFARGGRTLLPNPDRLFGLYQNELVAAFSARGRGDSTAAWHWRARVLGEAGRVVAERESTQAGGTWLHGTCGVDLTTEPAGAYDFELRAWQEGDAKPLERGARFSVAWHPTSWERNPRDVEDEAHFLLSADDEEAFEDLSPGEQERYLDDFWKARDPSPSTGENEARETFLKRVDYANRHYSHPALGKGMFSDMGRVFIRYGEPSEVTRQVIPTGDETLDQTIQDLSLAEDRPLGDVHMKGIGGDTRAFEVWIYDPPIGLPPDADPKAAGHLRQKRLVFLFVDERGTGDYRLRYTTE